jgi:hypothetical protein
MKIKHDFKIQEDGRTIKGQILETIFEKEERRGAGESYYSQDGGFYLESYEFPYLFSDSLYVWGREKHLDNNIIEKTYRSKEEAQKIMNYINEFTAKEDIEMNRLSFRLDLYPITRKEVEEKIIIYSEFISKKRFNAVLKKIAFMGFEIKDLNFESKGCWNAIKIYSNKATFVSIVRDFEDYSIITVDEFLERPFEKTIKTIWSADGILLNDYCCDYWIVDQDYIERSYDPIHLNKHLKPVFRTKKRGGLERDRRYVDYIMKKMACESRDDNDWRYLFGRYLYLIEFNNVGNKACFRIHQNLNRQRFNEIYFYSNNSAQECLDHLLDKYGEKRLKEIWGVK